MRETLRPRRSRLRKLLTGVQVVALAAVALVALPGAAFADPPPALGWNAPWSDRSYEPAWDYDGDGCYPTPAIGSNGQIATGLKIAGAVNGSCHDSWDLDNVNSYSRSKCNGDWCAYMYALYFEKDQTVAGAGGHGHTHDLEHVVVWLQNGNKWPQWVSVSAHGNYDKRYRDNLAWDDSGTHPKVIYHKDGGGTHAFRFANFGEQPENHKKAWQYPPLIGWNNYPGGFRDKLMNHDFGAAQFDIKDSRFADGLNKAKPGNINFNPWG